jgi:hypothetical protein
MRRSRQDNLTRKELRRSTFCHLSALQRALELASARFLQSRTADPVDVGCEHERAVVGRASTSWKSEANLEERGRLVEEGR